jgi:hypothetical protein
VEKIPSVFDPILGYDIKEMAFSVTELLLSKTNDLVDYSKIELNSFRPKADDFAVHDLFLELARIFRVHVSKSGNQLHPNVETCGDRELRVLADRGRIKQLLVKLLLNANKYTTRGHIWLQASENAENLDVKFSVKDSGEGISKDELERIFAPLHQKAQILHEHNRNSTRLPGFGLVLAKTICDNLGSSLKAESVKGKGSTFSFVIPVCRLYTTPRLRPRKKDNPDTISPMSAGDLPKEEAKLDSNSTQDKSSAPELFELQKAITCQSKGQKMHFLESKPNAASPSRPLTSPSKVHLRRSM